MLRSHSLAELVIDAIRPQVTEILISANEYIHYFERFGVPVFQDLRPGFLGPLAGIETALTVVPDLEWVFCTPVDTPFLPPDLVSQLMNELVAKSALCAVPVHNGLRHPLHCLIHASLLQSLTNFLNSGERSVGFWLRKCGMVEVDIKAEPKSFININTHDDLKNIRLNDI